MTILYHKGKNGELRQWRTWAEGPYIMTEHGLVGGQLQTSRKQASVKNVGRSNETTPEEQAILESKALHKHKLERKYSATPSEAQEDLYLPMLCHKFEGKNRTKFAYPGYLQPKLDGVRCLATREGSQIVLTSRQGKPWDVPHIAEELKWLPEGAVLDGEIYLHGESCQRITSLVKSAAPGGKSFKPESGGLEYHVYDIPVWEGRDDRVWDERRQILEVVEKNHARNCIRVVETTFAATEGQVLTGQGWYISEGYEGAVLRHPNGVYLWGYRSADLLKVKSFQDAEFTVIGAKEGRGKMVGCVVWICQNDLTAETFDCTMKVPMLERANMFKRQTEYLGKKLTVRFFDRTDGQIPRFPVGIVFRDERDL